MSRTIFLRGGKVTAEDVAAAALDYARVELAPEARTKLAAGVARLAAVEKQLGPVPLWKLADLADDWDRTRAEDPHVLARQILLDHAAAVGAPLPVALVRAAMLVRADVLAQGHSGVRPEIVTTLIDMLNARVHPVVPSRGHFAVAGDCAALAHIALVLCARDGANHGADGQAVIGDPAQGAPVLNGTRAMADAGLKPVRPNLKEAFSLVVGHSLAAGWAALLTREARRLWHLAIAAAALSAEAILANTAAFEPALLGLGPGRERILDVGRRLLRWTAGSDNVCSQRRSDAFSIRCIPQVLGSVAGTLDRVESVVAEELQLASDNPLLVDGPYGPRCMDGGNFHGERLAMALDGLRLATAEIGALSERHAFLLTNGSRNSGLPSFLIRNRGLNSGFMLAQYTAAALVSENKALAAPYATDSIPSCQDYEDHVGLSTHSAAATSRMLTAVRRIVAIEFLLAAQGIDLRMDEGNRPGREAARLHQVIRRAAPTWNRDTVLYRQIEAIDELCRPGGALESSAVKESADV